jgi:hypothetical protein
MIAMTQISQLRNLALPTARGRPFLQHDSNQNTGNRTNLAPRCARLSQDGNSTGLTTGEISKHWSNVITVD